MCAPVIRTRCLVMILTLALTGATAVGAQDAQPEEVPAEASQAAPPEMPADGPADATSGGHGPADAGPEGAQAGDPEASPGGPMAALRPMKEEEARQVIPDLMEAETQQEPLREGPAFDGDLVAQEGRPPIDPKKAAEMSIDAMKIADTVRDPKNGLKFIPQPVNPRQTNIDALQQNLKKAADGVNGALGPKPAAPPAGEVNFTQATGNRALGYYSRPKIELPFTDGKKTVRIPSGVDTGATIYFYTVPHNGGHRIEGRQGSKVWELDQSMNWKQLK